MKFIRKNGRIIPIRENGGSSNAGASYNKKSVAPKKQKSALIKKKKSYPKGSSFGVLPGAALGMLAGAGVGYAMKKPLGSLAAAGALGGAIGGSITKYKKAKGETNKHLMKRASKAKVKLY